LKSINAILIIAMTAILSTGLVANASIVPKADCVAAEAAFVLIPSQVPGARHAAVKSKGRRKKAKKKKKVAAIVSAESDGYNSSSSAGAGDQVVYNPVGTENCNKLEEFSPMSSFPASAVSEASTPSKKSRRKRLSLPRTGNLPDVNWRAIPLAHLRNHPNFQPLPPPSMIHHLPTKEHVRYFRQESWQWDYLHRGRCTTSQTAAALGFLEPKAAEFLGIPRSLQRGGGGAWERLREDLMKSDGEDSLSEMERILCEGRVVGAVRLDASVFGKWRPGSKETERLWISAEELQRNRKLQNKNNGRTLGNDKARSFPFMAKYNLKIKQDELNERKISLQRQRANSMSSPMRARMQWGNAQEATSILTALNYFCSMDERTTIHEIGMCGAGFDDADQDLLNGLKIGASPDALICHGNGTVEVLEVKNHCPFVWNNRHPKQKGKRTNKHKHHDNRQGEDQSSNQPQGRQYMIRDFDLERKIPPMYIPQLMMEMLCVGDSVDLDNLTNSSLTNSNPTCTSAVMVRQTATKGAILLRLYRDESWITEMKYWLGKFKSKYVNTSIIPPDNFFWNKVGSDGDRYQKFLQHTKELSESVEQVGFIPHGKIQRVMLENGGSGEIPLFLDSVGDDIE